MKVCFRRSGAGRNNHKTSASRDSLRRLRLTLMVKRSAAEGRAVGQPMAIFFDFGASSGGLGAVTFSTPLSKLAFTLLASGA